MKIHATEEVFTLTEVAQHLKVTVKRAQKMRRLGRFPHAVNIGTDRCPEYRVPISDITAIKNGA